MTVSMMGDFAFSQLQEHLDRLFRPVAVKWQRKWVAPHLEIDATCYCYGLAMDD